jgi:hypothetical protein
VRSKRNWAGGRNGPFPDKSFSAADATEKITPEAWSGVLSFKGDKPTGRSVGNWLMRKRDQRFTIEIEDGKPQLVTLQKTGIDRKGAAGWKIEAQEPKIRFGSKNPGSPPHSERCAEPAEPERGPAARTYNYKAESREVDSGSARFGGSAPDDPDQAGRWEIEL